MSRPYDYSVNALDKKTNEKGRVGSAWLNEDGTISIVLFSFVKLEGTRDLLVTLFKSDRKTE